MRPAAFALACPLALAACAPAPPCVPGTCGAARACLDGACRPAASPRVPADARRWVVAPEAIAVVGDDPAPGALPASATLGGTRGARMILVRFPAPWGAAARVAAAWIDVELAPGAPPPCAPLALGVAPVLEPWTAAQAARGSPPRTDATKADGWVRTPLAGTVRVDVTRLLARVRSGSLPDRGFAIVAEGRDAVGATLATGAAGGDGPRLEVWTR